MIERAIFREIRKHFPDARIHHGNQRAELITLDDKATKNILMVTDGTHLEISWLSLFAGMNIKDGPDLLRYELADPNFDPEKIGTDLKALIK